MASAQRLHLRPVAGGGVQDAARADHRLADEGRHPVAVLGQQRRQIGGIVVRHRRDVGDQRAEALPVRRDAGQAGAVRVHAVVGVPAVDDDLLLGPPQRVPVAAGELGGGVDRLRAAAGEEHGSVAERRQIAIRARPARARAGWPAGRTCRTRPGGASARRRRRRARLSRDRPRSTTGRPGRRCTRGRPRPTPGRPGRVRSRPRRPSPPPCRRTGATAGCSLRGRYQPLEQRLTGARHVGLGVPQDADAESVAGILERPRRCRRGRGPTPPAPRRRGRCPDGGGSARATARRRSPGCGSRPRSRSRAGRTWRRRAGAAPGRSRPRGAAPAFRRGRRSGAGCRGRSRAPAGRARARRAAAPARPRRGARAWARCAGGGHGRTDRHRRPRRLPPPARPGGRAHRPGSCSHSGSGGSTSARPPASRTPST